MPTAGKNCRKDRRKTEGKPVKWRTRVTEPCNAIPAPVKAMDPELTSAQHPGLHRHSVVRYRGFVLIPQADLTWLVRPERSPMRMLPFRAPASSVADVKALVDWRLGQRNNQAA
jgi:hypothetical protein